MPKEKAEVPVEETSIEEENTKAEETMEIPKVKVKAKAKVKAKIKAPAVPQGVSVSSLAIGAKFEHGGKLYQKRDSTLTIVSGLDLKQTEITKQMTWKGFSPNTLVIPK